MVSPYDRLNKILGFLSFGADNVQSGPDDRIGSGTSAALTSALTKWRPLASGHFA